MFCTGLTDGLRVAAQHAVVPALLLLDVSLHVAERCVHPLGKGLLHVIVVLLHLHRRNTQPHVSVMSPPQTLRHSSSFISLLLQESGNSVGISC